MIHTLFDAIVAPISWVQDLGLEGLRFRFRSLQSHLPEVGPSIGIGTDYDLTLGQEKPFARAVTVSAST
jgi:hypothetical protein